MCIYTFMSNDATNPARHPDCTCNALRKTARAITRRYEAALRPFALSPSQYTLISTLAYEGSQPLGQLAKSLELDRTTLTRNLQPLLRRKLVAEQAETDARIRQIALTQEGHALQQRAELGWHAVQQEYSDALGDADRDLLHALLSKVRKLHP